MSVRTGLILQRKTGTKASCIQRTTNAEYFRAWENKGLVDRNFVMFKVDSFRNRPVLRPFKSRLQVEHVVLQATQREWVTCTRLCEEENARWRGWNWMLLCRGLSRREGTREGTCSLVGDDGNYSFKHPPPLADSETSGLQIIHKIPEVLKTFNRYETEKKTCSGWQSRFPELMEHWS